MSAINFSRSFSFNGPTCEARVAFTDLGRKLAALSPWRGFFLRQRNQTVKSARKGETRERSNSCRRRYFSRLTTGRPTPSRRGQPAITEQARDSVSRTVLFPSSAPIWTWTSGSLTDRSATKIASLSPPFRARHGHGAHQTLRLEFLVFLNWFETCPKRSGGRGRGICSPSERMPGFLRAAYAYRTE